MSHKAAVVPEAKARITVIELETPKPKANQILIKNRAIATNPVDWKVQEHDFFVKSYPVVLGSDIGGTVEAVGEGVTHFQKGDRVTAFASSLSSGENSEGAFQEYSIAFAGNAAKIPDEISFEEGALLPMAVATAGAGIFFDLGIAKAGAQKEKGGFLVWGAASSVGTGAVQIAASLGFTVYATSSPHHNSYLKSLGAKASFNYKDSEVVENIISAAKTDGNEIQYVYDAISENGSIEQSIKVLEGFGGGKLALTLPAADNVAIPDNITASQTLAFKIVNDPEGFGKWQFNEWLENALINKTYVPSPAIEKVDGGLEGVQKALDLHRAGLSGKKLVLSL